MSNFKNLVTLHIKILYSLFVCIFKLNFLNCSFQTIVYSVGTHFTSGDL